MCHEYLHRSSAAAAAGDCCPRRHRRRCSPVADARRSVAASRRRRCRHRWPVRRPGLISQKSCRPTTMRRPSVKCCHKSRRPLICATNRHCRLNAFADRSGQLWLKINWRFRSLLCTISLMYIINTIQCGLTVSTGHHHRIGRRPRIGRRSGRPTRRPARRIAIAIVRRGAAHCRRRCCRRRRSRCRRGQRGRRIVLHFDGGQLIVMHARHQLLQVTRGGRPTAGRRWHAGRTARWATGRRTAAATSSGGGGSGSSGGGRRGRGHVVDDERRGVVEDGS